MTDRITLTIPREQRFHRVAHLVLGGLAVRLNLTLETLEDLQLALDALLEQHEEPGEVEVELAVGDDGTIEAVVGPFGSDRLRAELERDPQDGSVGLARLLATVVDDVEIVDRDDKEWVRLVKKVEQQAEAAG